MIIKGPQATALVKDAVVLDLGDLSRQAERLKEAAQARADQILREAREEAARLTAEAEGKGLEEGRARGFQEGYEQGVAQGRADALNQAKAELQRVQKLWQQAAGEVEAQRVALERDGRQAVLHLALRMAEKLVHRVVEVDETVIIDQLAHALGHVLRPVDVTVRINPTDRPVLEAAMPELLADFAQFKHVRLVDDAVIGPGGCVVSYGQGRVDATVETQLERIVRLILPGGMPVAHDATRDAVRPSNELAVNNDRNAHDGDSDGDGDASNADENPNPRHET